MLCLYIYIADVLYNIIGSAWVTIFLHEIYCIHVSMYICTYYDGCCIIYVWYNYVVGSSMASGCHLILLLVGVTVTISSSTCMRMCMPP